MGVFCSAAGILGMENPNNQKNNQKKRINSNYGEQISQSNFYLAWPGKEKGYISNLLTTSAVTFSDTYNNLTHCPTYKKLYQEGRHFIHLDDLLYTIARNPIVLTETYIGRETFYIYTKALNDLFSTAFELNEAYKKSENTENPPLADPDKNTLLFEKMLNVINLSHEILITFSDSIVESVREAARANTFSCAKSSYKKERAELLTKQATQEGEKNQIECALFKNKNKPRLFEIKQELRNKSKDIELTQCQLNRLDTKNGVTKLKEAINTFADVTGSWGTNRCWIFLQLGCLGSGFLLDLIEYCEENDAVIKIIMTLAKKFVAADRPDLLDDFTICLQNYVIHAFSGNSQKETEAKGYLWELAVAGFLLDTQGPNYRCMNAEAFNSKDETISCFFDHELEDCYIECKNSCCLKRRLYDARDTQLDKIKYQLEKEVAIARTNDKSFILISKEKISPELAQWLNDANIAYLSPDNYKNNPLGDASDLYEQAGSYFF